MTFPGVESDKRVECNMRVEPVSRNQSIRPWDWELDL